MPFESRQPHVL